MHLVCRAVVAYSHIYPGFTGKVSSLTYFPLEPVCEDYSFLDQAMTDFEQGLDSILADSLETPELDTFLDEPDAISSSVSCGFLHLVSTLSDTSKLQLASSIRSCKLWCQARAPLAPVPLATKMSASKLIRYFSSHPAAFGILSSTPPDNITLSSANRKVYQSLSDLHTSVGAAACATLDTVQLISYLRVALLDTHSCLSSMGLSQSFPSKRGGKARPWIGFHFTVQKRSVPGSSVQPLAKRPHLETGNEAHPSGKKVCWW